MLAYNSTVVPHSSRGHIRTLIGSHTLPVKDNHWHAAEIIFGVYGLLISALISQKPCNLWYQRGCYLHHPAAGSSLHHKCYYFDLGGCEVGYDEYIGLFDCTLAHLENLTAKLHPFFCMLPVVVALSSSDGILIR